MASVWSRRTLDLAHRYYAAARQCVWSNWAIERGEDWSPSGAEFTRDVEAMWISGCELLIAAHQAQIWARRIDPDTPEVLGLRAARNAIEHLDAATFDEDHVIATTSDDSKKAWDIKKLPEGYLLMGMARDPLNSVFGAVSVEAIVDFAQKNAYLDDDEPSHEEMLLLYNED